MKICSSKTTIPIRQTDGITNFVDGYYVHSDIFPTFKFAVIIDDSRWKVIMPTFGVEICNAKTRKIALKKAENILSRFTLKQFEAVLEEAKIGDY